MPRDRDKPAEDGAWLLDMLTAARAVQSFVINKTWADYEAALPAAVPAPLTGPQLGAGGRFAPERRRRT